jgi:hypothetical protein
MMGAKNEDMDLMRSAGVITRRQPACRQGWLFSCRGWLFNK